MRDGSGGLKKGVTASKPTNATDRLRYLTITAVIVALDQITKSWVSEALRDGGDVVMIRGFLNLSYTENPGIAFGMLNDGNVKWLLVGISFVAIAVVLFYLFRTVAGNRLLLVALSLLAGGIAGNLIDRIRMGRVIDFIEVYYKTSHFPVFNVADTAITTGAVLLAWDLFFPAHAHQQTDDSLKPLTDSSLVAGAISPADPDKGLD